MYFQCGKFRLSLERPVLMGVVNVTPDSFSDGGRFSSTRAAVAHARRLIDEGAHIVDIGGESTRPGSQEVGLDEERRRILPVLEHLADAPVPISIDTQKPELMREAIAAGAAVINDVNALQAPGAVEVVAKSNAGICLMHKQGRPLDMQVNPRYEDVLAEVSDFLAARIQCVRGAGIGSERIAIDPGFGFGKTLEHNLALLRGLDSLKTYQIAVMVGISRKSMLGKIVNREIESRVSAGIAAMLIAIEKGARIIRTHDVAALHDALAVWTTVNNGSQ